MKWISINEKLPKIDEMVLLYESYINDDYNITIGCLTKTKLRTMYTTNEYEIAFVDNQDEQPSVLNVSFWQPLPEPPE